MSDAHEPIVCATYTHARRHPMVLGQIGGWTPPFQLSITQIAVLLGVLLVEFQTWSFWARFLPGGLALVIAFVLPCLLAWAARRARLEGRSLVRTALGWLTFLSMPRTGRVGGRPYRSARAAPLGRSTVFVRPGSPSPGEQMPTQVAGELQ